MRLATVIRDACRSASPRRLTFDERSTSVEMATAEAGL